MSKQKAEVIRVFLVDDHPVVLEGLKSHFATSERIEVVGEASNGKDAIEGIKSVQPDVVVMDISLPDTTGIKVTRQLRGIAPQAKVLIMTMHNDRNYIAESVRAGARGYLLKDASPEDLVFAIESVFGGGAFFHSSISEALLDLCATEAGGAVQQESSDLTRRELEVLGLIAEGLSNKEIAAKLFVSVRTVECHREHMMRKLNIHGTAALTKYAITRGLTRIE